MDNIISGPYSWSRGAYHKGEKKEGGIRAIERTVSRKRTKVNISLFWSF